MQATATVIWPGTLAVQFKAMRDLDITPVLPAVEKLIHEGNTAGILLSTDGFGRPLTPLATSTLLRRHFTLSTKPLIPHLLGSRVITNFRTTRFKDSAGMWTIVGSWLNVLSKKGVPFLPYHFAGAGWLPVRDLGHVRPTDQAKIQVLVRNFILSKFRGTT